MELLDTVEASLARSGIDGATLVERPGETVGPPTSLLAAGAEALFRPDEVALTMHEPLGEGATGVVLRATQRALGRSVAVKGLKPGARSERATVGLLREAWVTGALEHPNIIPVHDLTRDDHDSPLVILKQVNGVDWSTLLGDEEAIVRRLGVEDPLEWNLRVLAQVAEAVAFAHERGFLHRDLKPQNVMIGERGEVYVVDWGLAVGLGDEAHGLIPLARDANELAGTPAYMAPEMLGGGADRLGPATDVYLLGAILFEILSGAPPHSGTTLMEIVASIAGPAPTLTSGPRELRELVARALEPEVSARLDDARALGRGIEAWLRHRSATRIAERAAERLAELEAIVTRGERRSWIGDTGDSVYAAFGECRFGFQQALEVWPESADGQDGLARAVTLMIRYELEQGQPRTAAALLAEHPAPSPGLQREVREAVDAERAETDRLQRLREALDPRTGHRGRLVMTGVLSVVWVLQPLVTGLLASRQIVPATHESLLVRNAILCAIIVGLGVYLRASLRRSRINRHLLAAALTAAVSQVLLHATDTWLGASVAETTRHQFPVWAAVTATLAASVHAVFAVPAIFYAGIFVVLGAYPELGFFASTAGNLVLILAGFFYLRRHGFPGIADGAKGPEDARLSP